MIFNPLFIDSDAKQINPVGFGKTNSSYLFRDIISVAHNFSSERSFNSTSILSNILSDIKELISSPKESGTKLDNELNLLLAELNISSDYKNIQLENVSPDSFKETSIISGSIKQVAELITEALTKLEEEYNLEIKLPNNYSGKAKQNIENESDLSTHITSLLQSGKPLTFSIQKNDGENLLTLSIEKIPNQFKELVSGEGKETLYSVTLTHAEKSEVQGTPINNEIPNNKGTLLKPDLKSTNSHSAMLENNIDNIRDTLHNNISKNTESLKTTESSSGIFVDKSLRNNAEQTNTNSSGGKGIPINNVDQNGNIVEAKSVGQNQKPSQNGINLLTVEKLENSSLKKEINSSEIEQKVASNSSVKSVLVDSKSTNQKTDIKANPNKENVSTTKINDGTSIKSDNQTQITPNDNSIAKNEESKQSINLTSESNNSKYRKDFPVDSKPLNTTHSNRFLENEVKSDNSPLNKTHNLNETDGKSQTNSSVKNDVINLNSSKQKMETNFEIPQKNENVENNDSVKDVSVKRINSVQQTETNEEIIIKLNPKQEKQLDEVNTSVRKNFVDEIEKILNTNKTNFLKVSETLLDSKEEFTLKSNQAIYSDNRFADSKKELKSDSKSIDQITDVFKKVEQKLEKINLSSQTNSQKNYSPEQENLPEKNQVSKQEATEIKIPESDYRFKNEILQKNSESTVSENNGKETKTSDSDKNDKTVTKNNTTLTETSSAKIDNSVPINQSNRQVSSENQPNNLNEAVHVRSKETFQPELNKKLLSEISDMAISDKKDKAIINLEPANLGKIRIALEIVENKLNARLEVESHAAKEMLTNQVDFLKESLNGNGLQLNTINISLQNSDQKQSKAAREKRKDTNVEKLESKDKSNKENKTKTLGYNTYEFIA